MKSCTDTYNENPVILFSVDISYQRDKRIQDEHQTDVTKRIQNDSININATWLSDHCEWRHNFVYIILSQSTPDLKVKLFNVNLNQGPHSFSIFELKTFLKTLFTTLTTYCEKFAIFLRKLKIH